MTKPQVLLISSNLGICKKVTSAFGKENVIIVTSFDESVKVFSAKINITTIIVDYSGEEVEIVKTFIKLRLLLGSLTFYVVATEELSEQFIELGVNEDHYCVFPCDSEKINIWGKRFKNRYRTLIESENLWSRLFLESPTGIGIVQDSNPEKSMFNPAFGQVIGQDPLGLIGENWWSITHPDDVLEEKEIFKKLNETKQKSATFEKRIIKPNQEIVWVHVHYNVVYYKDSTSYVAFIIMRDITKQKNIELNLLETLDSKTRLIQSIPGVVYRCKNDEHYTMEFLSERIEYLSGYKPEDLIDNKLIAYDELIVDSFRAKVRELWDYAIANHGIFNYQYQIKTKSNKIRWVLEQGEAVYDEKGDVVAIEGVLLDITTLKAVERDLYFKTLFDEYTLLPNRKSFINDLEDIDLADEHTFITVNLSDIRRTSSRHGHEYYLELRKSLADKLKEVEVKRGKLYLTQDEHFTFHFYYKLTEEEIDDCYKKIHELIIGTLRRETVRCGFGVTFTQKCTREMPDVVIGEQILNRTLMASEEALATQRLIDLSYYTEDLEKRIIREELLVKELRALMRSFEFGGLKMHYQPVFDLKTDKIIGFEALARYTSSEFGYISPLELFEIAERNRFSVVLGLKIFRLAFTFLAKLKAAGHGDQLVSVNLSTTQLLDRMLPEKLDSLANEFNVNLNRLVLELTEHIYADNFEKLNESVKLLEGRGIRMSVDDFGTGYSSLALIQDLKIWAVKVDRTFISKLTHKNKEQAITGDIISMCHKIVDVVVGEGVETKEQYEILKEFKCDFAQGYYLARPMPEADAVAILEKNNS